MILKEAAPGPTKVRHRHEPSRSQSPSRPRHAPTAPLLQRKPRCACGGGCPRCEEEREALQRKTADEGGAARASVPGDFVRRLGHGRPLDAATRAFMEPRFGHDFSAVRVHADTDASESAHSVGALAYTVGNHVVFGAGRYSPGSREGSLLLAHELAHVVQQSAAGSQLQTSLAIGEQSGEDEAQADVAAARVVAGHSVGGTLGARKTATLQRAVSVPILSFNQPGAQVCLVHLHGNEQNAQHTAESVWTDFCSNMVRLGSSPRDRCIDVNIPGHNCKADPNRIFSDQAIDADEPFTSECTCPAAARAAAKPELKTFRVRLEGAIGQCRGGSGGDISGPLPTVAFHNNTTPGGLSINSYQQPASGGPVTKDQLAAREGSARLAPLAAAATSMVPFPGGLALPVFANPSVLTGTGPDPDQLRDPDNFLLVTDVSDFLFFSPTHNVVLQGTGPEYASPSTPALSFDDGSLAVRMRNQRYINIEAQEKTFTRVSSPFYITDRHMAEDVMARLGVSRRPCPAPASGGGAATGGGTTGGAATGTRAGTTTTGATGTTTTGATTTPAPAGTGAATPPPCNSVQNALKPCLTQCRTFTDLPQLDALKGCWRSQINALPVADAVCWMIGVQRPPSAVREEVFSQRDCMLQALQGAAAGGSGINLPDMAPGSHFADWLKDYRPAVHLPGVGGTPQMDIWQRKFNFTFQTSGSGSHRTFKADKFDGITARAHTACRSLLLPPTAETQWDPVNDRHRVCWGVPPLPGHTAPPMPAGARALTDDEKQGEILKASSAPGVSRHHWGTDFDLFSVKLAHWTPVGTTPQNFSAAHDWLAGRPATGASAAAPGQAARFGFLQSFTATPAAGMGYMAEPWHWSYYPVAQALLEFSREPAVDAELQSRLAALWAGGSQFSYIAANWRDFMRHVNTTPSF